MFYDLHIHSCLSPCAEDEMTPNNICNMAVLKGLELIAVTDHNSCMQQPSISEAADKAGLKALFGAELQTSEEVHILGLFAKLEDCMMLQKWIDTVLPVIPNDTGYFGKEEIRSGADDELIGIENRLLLVSLQASLEETVDKIHECNGKAVLAHVLDRENSIINQLGFIPQNLNIDGLEVKNDEQKKEILQMHPWMNEKDENWFTDSDAHRLIDINEAQHSIEISLYQELWGNAL